MASNGNGRRASVVSRRRARPDPRGKNYKWIALSNCTLGVLLATLDASITLIAMPDIFRGIHLDPLVPAKQEVRVRIPLAPLGKYLMIGTFPSFRRLSLPARLPCRASMEALWKPPFRSGFR